MEPLDFLGTLVRTCPAYPAPLADCAVGRLRRVGGEAVTLEELSGEEVDDLVRGHFLCLCRKAGCGT